MPYCSIGSSPRAWELLLSQESVEMIPFFFPANGLMKLMGFIKVSEIGADGKGPLQTFTQMEPSNRLLRALYS